MICLLSFCAGPIGAGSVVEAVMDRIGQGKSVLQDRGLVFLGSLMLLNVLIFVSSVVVCLVAGLAGIHTHSHIPIDSTF